VRVTGTPGRAAPVRFLEAGVTAPADFDQMMTGIPYEVNERLLAVAMYLCQ
jgi:hypothetical protein